MRMDAVQKIADAVLYEGHLLYPYRASALKNQKRWNFGVLVPQAYSDVHPDSDLSRMQTESLVEGDEHLTIEVKVRFLQLVKRRVGRLVESIGAAPLSPPFQLVDSIQIGEQTVYAFDETIQREFDIPPLSMKDLLEQPQVRAKSLSPRREWQTLRDAQGQATGLVIREQEAVAAQIEITAVPLSAHLFKVTVAIGNETPLQRSLNRSREEVLPWSLIAAHTILAVEQGSFLSLIDPPDAVRVHVHACKNVGTWPVLAGEEGARSMLLSAPVILYDYPQIAPESPGDFFDGTEIDEMLALRVQTLTDQEKQEVRLTDGQAHALLERTEGLPAEHLWKLHGVVRSLQPMENQS